MVNDDALNAALVIKSVKVKNLDANGYDLTNESMNQIKTELDRRNIPFTEEKIKAAWGCVSHI